ncbi:MAG: GH3 auxin-responsive promoter family protein, partial [Clostridia bacterium]|nr:GH3 auxin-responsive promoter family protein [Clostridia bacterium]
MAFSDLGILIGDVTLAKIERTTKKPLEAQEKLLKRILSKSKNCELGKKYGFADIHSIDDF